MFNLLLGWVDGSLYLQHSEQQDEGSWHNNYSQHAFTTGRTQASKPRFKGSLTMKVSVTLILLISLSFSVKCILI